MNPTFLFASLVALAACGDAADPAAGGAGSGAPSDTMVVSADPELRAMALEMLPDLARRSGLALRRPVRLERRTRSELERYLQAKLDQELSDEEARHMTQAYAHLGLIPGDVDLRALLMSVYSEQVAGFYDPDSTALFVMEDQPPEALAPILLHELVHAVQDQWTDLAAATAPELGNDRRTAAQAVIEGHATLVMLEYSTEQLQGGPVDLTEIPDFAGQLRNVLGAAVQSYPALARAPRVIQEGLLLPYLEGAGFVLRVWQARGDRVAPFETLLPESTEQILDPSRFLGPEPDVPTALELESEGGTVVYQDGLGQAEVRVFLGELAGAEAEAAAEGWDGDRYLLIEDDEGASSLVWALIWDDAASRDRFVDTARGALDGLPQPAALEAVEVEGRPAAILRVGAPPRVRVTLNTGA